MNIQTKKRGTLMNKNVWPKCCLPHKRRRIPVIDAYHIKKSFIDKPIQRMYII